MAFHHVAFATRDSAATHRFYTEVMGFTLVKTNVSPTPGEHGGWSKHFFYATEVDADGRPAAEANMIAFWELHDSQIGDRFPVDINAMAGLPEWVNHLAFDAPTRADLDRHIRRWCEHGITVLEIDHGFCTSIYTRDPDNNMVEFCHSVRDFTAQERAEAERLLHDPAPPFESHQPGFTVHHPLTPSPAG